MFAKILSSSLCVLGVGIGLSIGAAHAQPYGAAKGPSTTLFTPPVAPDGSTWLDCYLTNVSDQPREATIYVLNKNGQQVVPPVTITLAAGEEGVSRADSPLAPRYCKFVVQGHKNDFRGSAVIQQAGVGTISAIAAE